MDTVVCPVCNTRVKLVHFGGFWMAACCKRIIYKDKELPRADDIKTVVDPNLGEVAMQ